LHLCSVPSRPATQHEPGTPASDAQVAPVRQVQEAAKRIHVALLLAIEHNARFATAVLKQQPGFGTSENPLSITPESMVQCGALFHRQIPPRSALHRSAPLGSTALQRAWFTGCTAMQQGATPVSIRAVGESFGASIAASPWLRLQ
jgi:hypothetical protein